MTREKIQESFSAHLCAKISEHYGDRFPSAATFAMHFNLRLPSRHLGISDETARRWLRGSSIPDAIYTPTLVGWLKLDLHRALCCPDLTTESPQKDPLLSEFVRLVSCLNPEKKQAFLHLLKLSAEPGA